MSAYLVSERHVGILIHARNLAGRHPGWTCLVGGNELSDLEFGRRLWRENMLSVGNRYDVETRARALVTDAELLSIFQVVKPKVAPSMVDMFKAIDCYCYQANEHDGWETSASKTWMDELRLQLIQSMPGYEQAPWGVP